MALRSILVTVAEAIVLALLVVDRVLEPDWNGAGLVAARGAIVVAAVVAAALPYQTWSTAEPRSQLLTVGMIGGLVGGAAVTASIVGADDVLFASLPLALLGLFGIVAAAITMRLDTRLRRDAS